MKAQTKNTRRTCPCVEREKCVCGQASCWHFGDKNPRCILCDNTGRIVRYRAKESRA